MRDQLKPVELKAQLATAKSELKETLERVQQLRDFITATERLCRRKGTAAPPSASASVTVMPQRRRTKAAALASRVAEILQHAGKPMHVRDIVAELAKRGEPIAAQNPVASVAVALGRRTDQFKKVSGNTFDLVKVEDKATG